MNTTNNSTTLKEILTEYYHASQSVEIEGLLEPTLEQIEALLLKEVGQDENIDDVEDIADWKYYDDYKSNAPDWVRGFNKAKAEIRTALSKLIKGNDEQTDELG